MQLEDTFSAINSDLLNEDYLSQQRQAAPSVHLVDEFWQQALPAARSAISYTTLSIYLLAMGLLGIVYGAVLLHRLKNVSLCNPIALTAFTDSVTSFELHPKFPASTVGPILIYYEIRPYFQNHDFHVRSIKNCPPIGTVATDDLMNMPIVKDAFYFDASFPQKPEKTTLDIPKYFGFPSKLISIPEKYLSNFPNGINLTKFKHWLNLSAFSRTFKFIAEVDFKNLVTSTASSSKATNHATLVEFPLTLTLQGKIPKCVKSITIHFAQKTAIGAKKEVSLFVLIMGVIHIALLMMLSLTHHIFPSQQTERDLSTKYQSKITKSSI